MPLPPDSHVHSEWSWDAPLGDMERTCAEAVALGLPAVAFTEHVDHTVWRLPRDSPHATAHLAALAAPDGTLTPPPFDPAGYLKAVDRCRSRFPGLRILTGVELGEPHWHAAACAELLASGRFDRVLGSLHCLPDRGGYAEPWALYPHRDPAEVVRSYLAGVAEMVAGNGMFEVLAHIDYAVRSWPGGSSPGGSSPGGSSPGGSSPGGSSPGGDSPGGDSPGGGASGGSSPGGFSPGPSSPGPSRPSPSRPGPSSPARFDPAAFEDEFRHALRVTAQSGRALEVNTRIPLHGTILAWWRDEGGQAITFGSDAHLPSLVGHGFREAAHLAEAYGFRPGRDPHGLWSRAG